MRPPGVLAVVGPTAAGKTALAETLARDLGAEIVCADSRQVYAELEIGTGRPTPAECRARPHHLFGALRLGQHASAGWYARAAGEACDAIAARGRPALLVGGSGLYLKALREGLAATPPHDPAVRERLRVEAEREGVASLHARLAAADPATAARLAPLDRQRVSRALEVLEITGRPLSWWHARSAPPVPARAWTVIEVVVEPAELRARIARRTTAMFDHGLVDETRAVLEAGQGESLRALRAIGYDEALELIEGRLDRPGAEARVNLRTAQLAKRQRTWFRHQIEALRVDGTGLAPEPLARAVHATLRAARGAQE
jgi:tRNA dimethylallyltransferase